MRINIDYLILFRYASGLSQRQLADKMGKDKDTVYRYESGKITPTIKSLNEWCKAVGADQSKVMIWE
jgi:transcriptional regulator with XRE-family HTH domain